MIQIEYSEGNEDIMRADKSGQNPTPEAVILRRRRALRDRALMSSALQKLAVLVAVVIIVFGIIFGLTPMKGGDMEPKLSAGDLLIYYRIGKEYARNDVVLMKREGKQYVGRLVGMPGESVIIKSDGYITVNDRGLYEEGIFYKTKPYVDIQYPVLLEDDEYFILADKRDTAKDSRYFGPVKKKEIKGKVLTTVKRISL